MIGFKKNFVQENNLIIVQNFKKGFYFYIIFIFNKKSENKLYPIDKIIFI